MNNDNLKPFSSVSEAREKGKKGGKSSAQARAKKKTIREIVEAYLAGKVKGNEELTKTAKKVGLTEDATIKELISAACLLNTMIKGDVEDLAKLAALVGEQNEEEKESSLQFTFCVMDLTEKKKKEKNEFPPFLFRLNCAIIR